MATDLNADIFDREEFSPTSVGDEGLDLVAWVPSGDNENGMLIIFGQCACTDDWIIKQQSSGRAKWEGILYLKAPHTNMVFIPIHFRTVYGGWHKSTSIQSAILIDRIRFSKSIGSQHDLLQSLVSYNQIERILEEKEPLV